MHNSPKSQTNYISYLSSLTYLLHRARTHYQASQNPDTAGNTTLSALSHMTINTSEDRKSTDSDISKALLGK